MDTQPNLSHLDRITQPKAQSGKINGENLFFMLVISGVSACSYNLYDNHKQEKMVREADILKNEENHMAGVTKKKISETLQEINERYRTLSIMGHPSEQRLKTTVAGLNVPLGVAAQLTDPYGKNLDKYYTSVSIPVMDIEHTVKIDPHQSGDWVQTLLKSEAKNKTGISDEKTYKQAIQNLRKQLVYASGNSYVKVVEGDVIATIIIPDAVAHAIKNKKSMITPSELKDILHQNKFNAEIVSVSKRITNDTKSESSSQSIGNNTNLAGGIGLGAAVGPFLLGGGSGVSEGNHTAATNGQRVERSETVSTPNFITGTHSIELSKNSALLHYITTAQDVHFDSEFAPKEHKKIRENLIALEEANNKLFGNKNTPDHKADSETIFNEVSKLPSGKKFKAVVGQEKRKTYLSDSGITFNRKGEAVFTQPANVSEFNNLLKHNGSISQQFIINTYGDNFKNIKKEIKEVEKFALESGKVPVAVGVSVPDEIINAKATSKIFDPSNPKHIAQAMGGDDPFKVTVNFAGKVHYIQVTPEEFAKKLPEKVVSALQLMQTENSISR